MKPIILEAKHIRKSFGIADGVPVVQDVSFAIEKGAFVSIMGRSGCGKSTLLYILSTMDTAYEGLLYLDGEQLTGQSSTQLARIRNEKIGFVFQFHYLLNEFSPLYNVMIPALKLNRYSYREIEEKASHWLCTLGLEQLRNANTRTLSGGEKQRVAIARALINDPQIIMGDEPTGNLDKKNREIVFGIFSELSSQYGQTLLMVTHDPELASRTSRVLQMEDGRILDDAAPRPHGMEKE